MVIQGASQIDNRFGNQMVIHGASQIGYHFTQPNSHP